MQKMNNRSCFTRGEGRLYYVGTVFVQSPLISFAFPESSSLLTEVGARARRRNTVRNVSPEGELCILSDVLCKASLLALSHANATVCCIYHTFNFNRSVNMHGTAHRLRFDLHATRASESYWNAVVNVIFLSFTAFVIQHFATLELSTASL